MFLRRIPFSISRREVESILSIGSETVSPNLQRTKPLLQGLLKGTADRHRFPDGFHRNGQGLVGSGKFFEGKPRNLHHTVVDRWLKTGWRLLGDVVRDFVQGITDSQLGGDLGDGESGCFGGKG